MWLSALNVIGLWQKYGNISQCAQKNKHFFVLNAYVPY